MRKPEPKLSSPRNPKVSVCITTYNHERFIEHAIDSVLSQETSFEYEILIGEDDSTDRTREIVMEYADRYPEKIRLFLHDRENNLKIGGIPTGRLNHVNNFKNARGKYVAILEGDDYWTDDRKLQLQVDKLDELTMCSLCFHNAEVLNDATGKSRLFSILDSDQIVSNEHIIRLWSVPTASILFRRSMLKEFPGWYFDVLSGDYALQLLLLYEGPFVYINRTMSVYRLHAGGIGRKTLNIWFDRNLSMMYAKFNKHTHGRFDKEISPVLAKRYLQSALSTSQDNSIWPSLKDQCLAIRYERRSGDATLRQAGLRMLYWLCHTCRLNARNGLERAKNFAGGFF